MLSKKQLFGSEKRKKNRNEESIQSQQWAKKIYDVLCKEAFSYIMSKARKTLGTTLHVWLLCDGNG